MLENLCKFRCYVVPKRAHTETHTHAEAPECESMRELSIRAWKLSFPVENAYAALLNIFLLAVDVVLAAGF